MNVGRKIKPMEEKAKQLDNRLTQEVVDLSQKIRFLTLTPGLEMDTIVKREWLESLRRIVRQGSERLEIEETLRKEVDEVARIGG